MIFFINPDSTVDSQKFKFKFSVITYVEHTYLLAFIL